MSDYWKADLTVAKYFRDNLMYLESLESYMEDLSAKMQYSKANSDLNAGRSNRGRTNKNFKAALQWCNELGCE